MSGFAQENPLYQPAVRLITNILRNNVPIAIGETDGDGDAANNVATQIGPSGLTFKTTQYFTVGSTILTVSSNESGLQPLSSNGAASGLFDIVTGDYVITGADADSVITFNLVYDHTVVQTSFAHDYVDDLIIKLFVPKGYGMTQVNERFARIRVLSDTTFAILLDTNRYDAFIYPDEATRQRLTRAAMCTPTGSFNNTTLGATRNVLPFNGIPL